MKQPRTFSSVEPRTFENRSSQRTSKSPGPAPSFISEDSRERAESCVRLPSSVAPSSAKGGRASPGRQAGRGPCGSLTTPAPCPVLSQTRAASDGGWPDPESGGCQLCLHRVYPPGQGGRAEKPLRTDGHRKYLV